MPIFWNKRIHEKEEVLEAAQRVCDMLTECGVTAGCDTTVEMSPGQKFRHWCAVRSAARWPPQWKSASMDVQKRRPCFTCG